MKQILLAVIIGTLTLTCCGFVIAVVMNDYFYVEPVWLNGLQAVTSPAVLYPPGEPSSNPVTQPSEAANNAELYADPHFGHHYYPVVPDELTSVDGLEAIPGSVYLTELATLQIKEAWRPELLTLEELLTQLREPAADLLQRGFIAPLPDNVTVEFLGIAEQTLFALLTFDHAEAISSLGEALLCDALVLSLLTFPGVEQVQFVVDLSLGYQGRLDLHEPKSELNLSTGGIQ